MSALTWLQRLVGRFRGTPSEQPDPEAARNLFQRRYHALRLLLAANTQALSAMAAMEQAAIKGGGFGMTFVRSHCTAVGVNVFKMVRNLDILAPEKYTLLFDRLEEIQHRIDDDLATIPTPGDVPHVLPMAEIQHTHIDVTGSKMATLGEVANVVGLSVPGGFVITTSAFDRLIAANDIQPEISRLLQAYQSEKLDELFVLSSKLQQLILTAEVPPEIADAIVAGAEAAEPAPYSTFALRSSALGEDSAGASFAGQYETLLNVRRSNLVASYLEIVASTYTPQAMQYRKRHGLREDQVAMSVGCLEMIDARSGGVVYSGNPGDDRDSDIYISSAWGLPKSIVDGRFASDLIIVKRAEPPTISSRDIGDKRNQFVLHPREGVRRADVPDAMQRQPSLADHEALAIADAAMKLESHFGTLVDVEWAMTHAGDIVILQCRPLTQLRESTDRSLPADTPKPLISGGVNASPGAAAGPVHWVTRDMDALSFSRNSVLALVQPLPRWAALLDRTAAVVAEEGGIAGHLATVARELGVPAILGAGSLADLENGFEVTVDASGRAVYAGTIDALIEQRAAHPEQVADSPVRRTLRTVLTHISLLNLVDPKGLDFTPENCKTMHDITRFCHEQAVREIFAFGTETKFPEYASKQLHHNVPMQWWILDLGGGFGQPVSGKYVRLEDIACKPMLALWDGMVAVPWDGPPATSRRGLASILFEATANPALASPFKKPYADRNYFIISEHFLNLQSRFGFHFTNVEALAGPRLEENYLSFSFKGGAADLERKAARARFIGDLLAELSFDTEVIEDVVNARRTSLDHQDVEQGLRVVGYLLMHTRQLDMIMADRAAVAHYGAKIRADLTQFI
ncbi:MAG: PEP-utilizing enzyme [Acidobacteriota bacterium]|nr:PEP-utilizing enzyme [Acidobacteriota bacterium]